MTINTRRSSLEVVADILRIEGSKTALMYGANLSYAQTQKYLQLLQQHGLLDAVNGDKGGRTIYRATAKGQRFLDLMDAVQDLSGIDIAKVGALLGKERRPRDVIKTEQ